MQGSNLPRLELENWNNRLLSESFLDVRPDDTFLASGNVLNGYLKDKFIGRLKVVLYKPLPWDKITEWISQQVIGKPPQYLKTVLGKKYPNSRFCLVLLKHLDHEKTKDQLVQHRSEQLGLFNDGQRLGAQGLHRNNKTA